MNLKYLPEITKYLKDTGTYIVKDIYITSDRLLGVSYRPAGTRLVIHSLVEDEQGNFITVAA